jgi:hypothetical protein
MLHNILSGRKMLWINNNNAKNVSYFFAAIAFVYFVLLMVLLFA